MQRYDLISVDALTLKLKRMLLYNQHILLPQDQAIDHKILRPLLAEKRFQDFLRKYQMDGRSPILVGLDPNFDTLAEVAVDAVKKRRVSSSFPEFGKLLRLLPMEPSEKALRLAAGFSDLAREVLSVSDFVKNSTEFNIDYARNEKNYISLVKDAIDNFPKDLTTDDFRSYLETFRDNVTTTDPRTRSDLIKSSEKIAAEMKVPIEQKTKLQFLCQDVPYNINSIQGNVGSMTIANNAFTQSILDPNPLTPESLKAAYERLTIKDVAPAEVPLLNRLTFEDIGSVRGYPGFEATLAQLEKSGNRNLESAREAHHELIASALVALGKVPAEDKSRMLKTIEIPAEWHFPSISLAAGVTWTVLQFVVDPPHNETFNLLGAGLEMAGVAYWGLHAFAKYHDDRLQRQKFIREQRLFKN